MIEEFTKEQKTLTVLINRMLGAIGYFDYYRNMAVSEFSNYIDFSPLPKTWSEWLQLPIKTRREVKTAAPEALSVYQKALKDFDEPFNPVSPTQKLRLFYHFFGSPANTTAAPYFFSPPWLKTHGILEHKSRGADGEYTPAVDRESLEKIIKSANDDKRFAAYWAAPFAHVCLAISDISKSLGFLNCKLERGLFKSSFGVVTETGRLASRQNAQGYGCFTPHAEALTQTGWKYIEDIKEGELVVQYDNGTLSWAPAIPHKADMVNGEIFNVRTKQTSFSVTPDHRLLCMPYNGKVSAYPQTALELFKETRSKLILSGQLNGNLVLPRIIIALLADGSLERAYTRYWRIGFTKTRKIARFKELCAEAGITYNTLAVKENHNITARFSINAPKHWPTVWGDWILRLSQETIKSFLAELGHWDGSFRGESTIFYTAKRATAVWVQTLAHLGGMAATITISQQSLMSYSTTLMYRVNIKPRKFAIIENKHKGISSYTGPVYCLVVPSSYFLVRQHDKVFVTGNSNAQNVSPKLRHIFIAPPNEKFILVDYAQIESRIVAAICFRLFGLENYIAGTESGDLHSLAASMVWPNLPWPEDFTIEWCIKHGPFPKDMLKAAKAIASIPFYRGKSRRDVSKTLGHGTSYMGKPFQMSKHSHIDIKLIEHYQEVFFSVFPEIRKWHRWVAEQVQTKGEITTMLGRTRRFFGRPNDDATIREAVAYEPQSVAADYCNRALLRLHNLAEAREFPAKIRLSKHDELVVSCPERLEAEVLRTMKIQMQEHITLTAPNGTTRDWFVPAECESGWNMGKESKTNPNGISHPLDGRKRTITNDWNKYKL
jgi:hypothetical protein